MPVDSPKIAVIGAGAREHALAWRFARELGDDSVCITPGGDAVPGSFAWPVDLGSVLLARGVDTVVIGPEDRLAAGLADELRALGIAVLGPGVAEARLETSKAHAKDFMRRHGVPTAPSLRTTAAHAESQLDAFDQVVLKFDGLAAGKGSFVCADRQAACAALATIHARWGASAPLLIEQRLHGRELSLMVLVADGQAALFPPVEDYKPLLDGDRGPNTGSMGALSPAPFVDAGLRERLVAELVAPTLRGLAADYPRYRGVLYLGVMVTPDGPKLLEYNARFGDPEAQVLALGLQGSFAQLCAEAARGRVRPGWLPFEPGCTMSLVLAAPGYPDAPRRGASLAGLAALPAEVQVFHAGSRRDAQGSLRAHGGRVLSLTTRAPTLEQARARLNAAALQFPELVHRRDLGLRRGGPGA